MLSTIMGEDAKFSWPQSWWDDPREAGEAELARLAAQFEEDERDPMWKPRHRMS